MACCGPPEVLRAPDDWRYPRTLEWKRLVTGDDVPLVLAPSFDKPLLPSTTVEVPNPLHTRSAQQWFTNLPDDTARAIMNTRRSMLREQKITEAVMGMQPKPPARDPRPTTDAVMGHMYALRQYRLAVEAARGGGGVGAMCCKGGSATAVAGAAPGAGAWTGARPGTAPPATGTQRMHLLGNRMGVTQTAQRSNDPALQTQPGGLPPPLSVILARQQQQAQVQGGWRQQAQQQQQPGQNPQSPPPGKIASMFRAMSPFNRREDAQSPPQPLQQQTHGSEPDQPGPWYRRMWRRGGGGSAGGAAPGTTTTTDLPRAPGEMGATSQPEAGQFGNALQPAGTGGSPDLAGTQPLQPFQPGMQPQQPQSPAGFQPSQAVGPMGVGSTPLPQLQPQPQPPFLQPQSQFQPSLQPQFQQQSFTTQPQQRQQPQPQQTLQPGVQLYQQPGTQQQLQPQFQQQPSSQFPSYPQQLLQPGGGVPAATVVLPSGGALQLQQMQPGLPGGGGVRPVGQTYGTPAPGQGLGQQQQQYPGQGQGPQVQYSQQSFSLQQPQQLQQQQQQQQLPPPGSGGGVWPQQSFSTQRQQQQSFTAQQQPPPPPMFQQQSLQSETAETGRFGTPAGSFSQQPLLQPTAWQSPYPSPPAPQQQQQPFAQGLPPPPSPQVQPLQWPAQQPQPASRNGYGPSPQPLAPLSPLPPPPAPPPRATAVRVDDQSYGLDPDIEEADTAAAATAPSPLPPVGQFNGAKGAGLLRGPASYTAGHHEEDDLPVETLDAMATAAEQRLLQQHQLQPQRQPQQQPQQQQRVGFAPPSKTRSPAPLRPPPAAAPGPRLIQRQPSLDDAPGEIEDVEEEYGLGVETETAAAASPARPAGLPPARQLAAPPAPMGQGGGGNAFSFSAKDAPGPSRTPQKLRSGGLPTPSKLPAQRFGLDGEDL